MEPVEGPPCSCGNADTADYHVQVFFERETAGGTQAKVVNAYACSQHVPTGGNSVDWVLHLPADWPQGDGWKISSVSRRKIR